MKRKKQTDSPITIQVSRLSRLDDLWFRRKGYGGSGDSWVTEFHKARIFARIGGARGIVSWWAKNYPTYAVPNLVILHIGQIEAIDETQRLADAKVKEELRKAKQAVIDKQRKIDDAARATESAQRDLEAAQRRLTLLKGQ